MKIAENWKDYELIATSRGQKLERWGDIYLLRPDPQVIWDEGDLLENIILRFMPYIIEVIKVEVLGKI